MTQRRAVRSAPRATSGYVPLSACAILLAVAAAFGGSLRNEFVSDDKILIEDRLDTYRSDFSPVEAFRQSFWKGSAFDVPRPGEETKDYYRPLVTLSYALDARLWGNRPAGFRLTNLALHLLSTGLLLALLRRWGVARPLALAAALLFACHPLHVCSVVWIAGRTDLLATVFFLAALAAGDRLLAAPRARPAAATLRRPALWWMLGALLLSLLSKELGFVFPGLFLLVAGYRWRQAAEPGRAPAAARPPYLEVAMLGALIAAFLLFRAAVLGLPDFRAGQQTADAPFRFGMFPAAYAYYWRVFFYPGTLHFHVPLALPASAADPRFLLALGLLLAQVAAAVLLGRKLPLAALGVGWVLVTLLPVSHLVPLAFRTIVAEYWAYLPSAGFVVFVAGAAQALAASGIWRRRFSAERAVNVAAAALAAIALISLVQIPARASRLRTEETLLLHTVRVHPAHTDSWVTLGAEYGERGRLDLAERYLREAIRRDPRTRGAWMNMANVFHLRGDADSALVAYRRELEYHPHKDDARVNLADMLIERGDITGAAELYREALRRNPRNRDFILSRSALLRDARLDPRSRALWVERAPELRLAAGIDRAYLEATGAPDRDVLASLVRLELALGETRPAASHAAELRALAPVDEEARALDLLARVASGSEEAFAEAAGAWIEGSRALREAEWLAGYLETVRRPSLALGVWRALVRAKRLEPDRVNHLAASLSQAGSSEEAAALWRAILEEIPDYRYALLNLGGAAAGSGDAAAARRFWNRFLVLNPDAPEAPEVRRRLAMLPPAGAPGP